MGASPEFIPALLERGRLRRLPLVRRTDSYAPSFSPVSNVRMQRASITAFLSRRERAAMEAIRCSGLEFTDASSLPHGVGQRTLDKLVQRGLLDAGPSKAGKMRGSYRISDDGWICMFGVPFAKIQAARKKPLSTWTWPSEPGFAERSRRRP